MPRTTPIGGACILLACRINKSVASVHRPSYHQFYSVISAKISAGYRAIVMRSFAKRQNLGADKFCLSILELVSKTKSLLKNSRLTFSVYTTFCLRQTKSRQRRNEAYMLCCTKLRSIFVFLISMRVTGRSFSGNEHSIA